MQSRGSIIDLPLLVCLVLSIALHAAALFVKGIYSSAQPRFETGRTVVKLTLAPSLASRASAPEPAESAPPAAAAAQSVDISRPRTPSEQQTAEASEQNASLIKDKGVTTEATAASSIQPVYPRVSRLRGEEGVVTLSIEVTASGKAGNVNVVRTSRYRRLDEAAVRAARSAAYAPAKRLGRTVDSVIELSFTFRLTDD